MGQWLTPRALLLASAFVVVLTGAGIAYATGSVASTGDQIRGCYNQTNGQLRIDAVCKPGEMAVAWEREGQPGPPGPAGQTGSPGRDGRDGRDGREGRDGASGLTGRDGRDGTAGASGAPGTSGATGPEGPAGGNGQDGSAGVQGQVGASGAQGSQGPPGPAGAEGQPGLQGPQGPAGAQGQAGSSPVLELTMIGFQAQDITSADTGGFVKALDVGSFTKVAAGTDVRVDLDGVGLIVSAPICIWELRVDDQPTSNKQVLYGPSRASSSLNGVFQGIAPGVHTVSVWVDQRDPGDCNFNAGNFNFTAVVEEIA